jgi:hypothetical protein
MYQPYPGGARVPEPAPRPPVPASIHRAVQAMYLGAAASLIGIIIDFSTLSATKKAIENRTPKLTPDQVTSAEHVVIGLFIFSGLIGAALWLWMAQTCKAGRNWARIVAAVLFGIDTIAQVLGASALSAGGVARIYALVIWLIGLAATILLWQRESTAYFQAQN